MKIFEWNEEKNKCKKKCKKGSGLTPFIAFIVSKGQPIGPNDFLIAAIALANHKTLVTHNTREFSRIEGLLIEDWQQNLDSA